MQKIIYLLRCPASLSLDRFNDRVRQRLTPDLLAGDPLGLKVSMTEPGPRRPRLLPFRRQGLAMVCLWLRDGEAADPWTARIRALDLPFDGYAVGETIPRAYDRTWPDGDASPGLTMLTLFRRRRGLDQATFMERWQVGHLKLALGYHPSCNYVRNAVERPLTEGAAPWAGIVEEHFRSNDDLTDMRRFVGGGGLLKVAPRLAHILVQTGSFLDLLTLENHLLVERWARTPA